MNTRSVDGESRLACSKECGYVFWNNPIPASAGLIEINGKFLLARNQAWPAGFFSLISGFIERGESPENAMIRETEEELGLKATSVEFIGHYPFPPMNQLMIAYVVKTEGEVNLSDELSEYILLSKAELVSYDFGALKLGRTVVDQWLSQQA
ncbi:MAG: NUDIX hydrolase [Moraxellaceae bacterium]|nr:MAG: NUDIX hydrolase [Moraxellaceae bacterium]